MSDYAGEDIHNGFVLWEIKMLQEPVRVLPVTYHIVVI